MRYLTLLSLVVINMLLSSCRTEKPFLEEYSTKSFWLSDVTTNTFQSMDDLAFNRRGESYVATTIFGKVNLCNGEIRGPGYSGLVIKYNSEFKCHWAVEFEGKDASMSTAPRCFISGVALDGQDSVITYGIFTGNLYINRNGANPKDPPAIRNNGKLQSFVAKMDTSGQVKWCRPIHSTANFTVSEIIRTSRDSFVGVGILDEGTTRIFGMGDDGIVAWTKDLTEPSKISNCLILETGGNVYVCTLGNDYVHLRKLDNQFKLIDVVKQKTNASLLSVRSHFVQDVNNGIWLALTFNDDGKEFVFGKDKMQSTGQTDVYLTLFRNDVQVFSTFIQGKNEQIATGIFEGNKKSVKFGLAHLEGFTLGKTSHTTNPNGITLMQFNLKDLSKVTYSTFPLINKVSLKNCGITHQAERKNKNYLFGNVVKSRSADPDPTLTINNDVLVVKHETFQTFAVNGTRKKGK